MSTATREPGTDSPVSDVLTDIEKYGRQFIHERDVHAIFTRSLDNRGLRGLFGFQVGRWPSSLPPISSILSPIGAE